MDSEPLTITAAAPLIRGGQLTPSDLLEQCLARIDRYEEKVRAWVYLDRERARTEAAQLTDEIKNGHYRGPLHGIPVGIKDIIDVFDMPTGCGSKLWANSYARRDATCVQRLRVAGALILGKTVTTPYASFDPPVTRNPWNLDRTPGGSSSGSAAAVACGMCLAALGTQTGGSLIRPASYCGVCCLKPSYNRVSTEGVLPLAPSLDHIGVMSNCVRDLAAVLQVVATTNEDSVPRPYHYLAEINSPPLHDRRKQLARLPDYLPDRVEPVMAEGFDRLRDRTRGAGWAWNDLPLAAWFTDVPAHHRSVMAVEVATVHRDRFARRPDDYPPRIAELITDGLRLSATEYSAARDHLELARDRSDDGFVDSWQTFCLPAASGAAPDTSTTGDPALLSPWSFVGLPVVTVPFNRSADGLPLGVQLVGRMWCEDDLLHLAAKLESDLGLTRDLPPG